MDESRIKDIDQQGASNLVQAIVNRAALDFMYSAPSSVEHRDAEDFFRSSWFAALTGFDGKTILRRLQAEYDKKRQKHKGGQKQ